jgi:hypothetical protein
MWIGKENRKPNPKDLNPNPIFHSDRQEQTLNQLFPHSDKPEKNNSKKERGKKG